MHPTLKKTVIYTAIFLIIGLLIYPKIKPSEKKEGGGKGEPNKPAPPIKVDVETIEYSNLNFSLKSIGTILAFEQVPLKSEVSGKVTQINFKEGQRVNQGQLLIKINDSDLQAEIKKALLKHKLAVENNKRIEALYAKGGISEAEKEASNSEVEILASEVDLLKAKIAKTEIKAPFAGTIGLGDITLGRLISPNEVITELVQLDKVKLAFNLPEKYAHQVKIGSKINFKVQGQNEIFEANIYAVSPVINETTRTIELKAVAINKGLKLKPGAFADIEISLNFNNAAIQVPTEAVVPDMKGHKVYLYKSGEAIATPVKLGVRKEKLVQIIEGLEPRDTLITSGILQLKPNAAVKIKKGKS